MYKLNDGYYLRNVLDVYVIMGTGKENYTPHCIMSVNETGAFLWKELESGADQAELVERLTEEFDVSAETAATDVERFLSQLRDKNLIKEC